MSSTTANIPTTGQWISVKDRMPNELQAVLVHGKHENEYYNGFGVTSRKSIFRLDKQGD